MLYTIYYIHLNRMDTMKVCGDLALLRKKIDEIVLAGGFIQCIKDINGELITP